MGNVINLGRARKRKHREAAARQADANAVKHGRTKAEKTREQQEGARLRGVLDGARLDAPALDPDLDPTSEPAVDPTSEPGEPPPRQ